MSEQESKEMAERGKRRRGADDGVISFCPTFRCSNNS